VTAEADHRPALRYWAPLLPLAAVLVVHSLYFDFVSDDAYISFVYSRNLAEHGQLVFNLGERVEGYTNFLWTVLLALGMKLGVGPDLASRVLGTVFGMATLPVAASLLARVRGRRSAWDWLPAGLLVLSSGYACWCSGGLETQLFTFTFVLGVERLWAGRFVAAGAAFAACAMTRPEGVLLFGLAALHWTVVERRIEWRSAATFLALYVPYFAWRYWYYGDLLPNTAYVKTGGTPSAKYAAEMHAQGAFYLWQWASQSKAIYALPLVAVAAWKRPRFASFALLVLVVYLVYTWRVGGDFMGLHRFVMPLFVLVALLAAVGAAELSCRLAERLVRPGWQVGALVAAALAIPFALSQVALSRASRVPKADRGIDRPGYLELYAHDRGAIGAELRKLGLREDELSWVGGVGVQPYYGHMRAYDVFGLVSRQVAHEVPPTRPRPGHQKWAPPDLVLATNPSFIFYCYQMHREPTRYTLCGEAGYFHAHGFEDCTIHVPGLRESGEYYTFLKKKEREFPCLSAAAP
jgi:arabinofuranosyltransferase